MRSLGLRIIGGAISGGAIASFALFPAANPISAQPSNVFTQNVPPAPLQLVCPGAAIELGGEDGTNLDSVERLGTADLAIHLGDAGARLEYSPDSRVAETSQLETWSAIQLENTDFQQGTDLLSAAQYQVVSNARNRGLLAANCAQPSLQHTFVGGSLEEGHETLLVLANPGSNESGVSVRLTTDTGFAEENYALAAGSESIIPLAALGSGESSIAIQVSSTQPIAAWLQHRASAGLVPLGISLVPTQPDPKQVQTIFGLVVRGVADAPAPELVTPSVRIFNPGSTDTEALVEVTGVDSFGAVVRLNVPAGRVREAAIEGLADGEYSVRISAESQVFAALDSPIVVSSGATDFAWLAGSDGSSALLRFPPQPVKGSLVLFNSGSSEMILKIDATRPGSATQSSSVILAPLQQQIVEIAAGRSALITEQDGKTVHALVRYLNGNGIGYWQPSINRNPGSEIMVSVR